MIALLGLFDEQNWIHHGANIKRLVTHRLYHTTMVEDITSASQPRASNGIKLSDLLTHWTGVNLTMRGCNCQRI
jgi:hypothetical protein